MMGIKQGNHAFLSINQLASQCCMGFYHVPSRCEAPPVDKNKWVNNCCGINWLQTKHLGSRGSRGSRGPPGQQYRMNGKPGSMHADWLFF